ncbi:uncharacterized protein zbtb32 [Polymixia lowei]
MIRINNTEYSHFLQQADALRRSGSLCDTIISVESQTFRAHRLVLACASRRLAEQLAQGDADGSLQCTLKLFSPHTFQQVLDFTYTRALEVPVDDLELLLRAAQLLEIQPLEDQCRRQLDTLDRRAANIEERREVTERTEAQGTTDEQDQEEEGCAVPEKTLKREPKKEANNRPVTENPPPTDTVEDHTGPPSPRKRLKISTMSETPSARDSVITSPAASHPSLSSPWAKNKWYPGNVLRQMALNYSNVMAAHALQPSQQVVAYPFSLSMPNMYPLLASSFPSQVHSSVMGCSGIHQAYTQHPFARSPEPGDEGMLTRKNLSQKGFIGTIRTIEQRTSLSHRHPEGHKARAERIPDCQHCSTSLLGNPWLQKTTSTPSGEACGGCRFCRRGDGADHTLRCRSRGHGVEKPYLCKHCPKRFSLKHQLDTHHRVHTGEKPFECRLCGQRSRDYSAMIKHLRTHGGATPYQCTVCLEFCSSLVAMQRHVKNHPVQDFPSDWSINNTYLYTSHA